MKFVLKEMDFLEVLKNFSWEFSIIYMTFCIETKLSAKEDQVNSSNFKTKKIFACSTNKNKNRKIFFTVKTV